MIILALDTTSDRGGVGIFRDAECLALVPNQEAMNRFSVSLFEMAEQALKQAHVGLGEIDLYAAATGPGSFTGIRIGLAAARAWGTAFNRHVRGVSVLEAMVETPSLGAGPERYFPVLDARRGEFYVGNFRRGPAEALSAAGAQYEPADQGWVLNPESLRAYLEEILRRAASGACLVRAHDTAAANLRASLPAALGWQQVEGDLLGSIAAVALREERSGRDYSATDLDAYYIRRPDAEINLGVGS
jgi:tRNA threonylcarbamoyl adenosine modification protein YeaZ